jgi:hypothetical protein
MAPPRTLRRRIVALVAAAVTSFGGSAMLLSPLAGTASSHREAPTIAADPAADNTDVYAFVSPDDKNSVTLISNWWGFQQPTGGPNFYFFDPAARYLVHIDNNGDAKPDITYQWTFKSKYKSKDTFLYNTGPVTSLNDKTLNFTQTYKLEEIRGGESTTLVNNGKVAPSHVGDASMPNYAALRDQAITSVEGGGRSFVGQADDPFFLDLRVFDLLYGGDLSETGDDTLKGLNVQSVALQVPANDLTKGNDPVIGVWSTTERPGSNVINDDGSRSGEGDFVQVSRLGNPLVNEVVIPIALKDAFNALKPENDASVDAAVDRVNNPELPKLIEAIYGIPAPKTPRDDLFSIYLTGVEGLNKPKGEVTPAEMLRLNTSIPPTASPNPLGVLAEDTGGFPNGRRLEDDVVDISIQAVEGAVRTGKLVEALATGDGVAANDKAFSTSFPYLALPHSGSDTTAGASSPTGGVDAGGGGTADPRNGGLLAAPADQQQSVPPALPISLAGLGVLLGAAAVVTMRRNRTSSS